MKSKLEIYALSICFVSVVCLVISFGVAGYSAFEITAPELTINSYKYEKLISNDEYWKSKSACCEEDKKEVRPSEEELTNLRLRAKEVEVSEERRGGVQTLIKCFMFIFASGSALLIHWKIAKKARAA